MPSLGAVYIRDISGHAALIDSSGNMQVNVVGGLTAGAGVSGNPVTVSSGNINVQSGIWLASGIVVNISGQTVNATVNTTTNVSGQQIYLGSGSNYVTLSGALVSVSGTVLIGNSVVVSPISGAVSIMSGNIFVGSGTVSLGAGSAAPLSGVAVSNSGSYVNIASGSVAALSGVPIGVSGQTLSIASGIYLASGISVIANVSVGSVSITSGNFAVLSGSITVNSGQVAVSGIFAGLSGGAGFQSGAGGVSGAIPVVPYAWDYSGIKWNPFSVPTSGSNLLNVSVANSVTVGGFITISGAISVNSGAISVLSGNINVLSGAIVLNSGQTIVAASGVIVASGIVPNISGQVVTISGSSIGDINMGNPPMVSGFGFSGTSLPVVNSMWDFSGGAWVPLSSVTSGNNSSLAVAQQTASQIRIGLSGTAVQSGLPNSSGGTALQSGDLYVITVRNVSGNNDMYIGGSGAKPFSGFGFVLCGGDALTMSITNANLIYIYATTSGQFVKWIGSQY